MFTQGPLTMEKHERIRSIEPAGVLARACVHRRPDEHTGSPSGDHGVDQPAARERQAGPYGVAERPGRPMKPGNAGGGKGPQLKTNATSNKGPRDWR